MIRRRITTTGNSAALVLSQDVMDFMGVEVGDEVELSLVGGSLLVRPVRESKRAARIAEAMGRVFREHAGLLRRLARRAGGRAVAKKVRGRVKR